MIFSDKTPIEKGWSGDKKYRVTDARGQPYLLRISPMEQHARKEREFALMQQVAALGIPMCRPVEFGTCADGVYSLQSWIKGVDAEDALKERSVTGQYQYGLQAGQILKKLHQIPAPDELEPWGVRFSRKIDRKQQMYAQCPIKYENGAAFLQYIEENRHLICSRPQVYQHGDYHIGNMMLDASGALQIIDFDRCDYGDPWEEFNRIVWCAQTMPAFASGMVDGYFDGAVPMDFWQLLALYISVNTLSSLPWAIPFGEGEIHVMKNQAQEVLDWYEDMTRVIPSWYTDTRKTSCVWEHNGCDTLLYSADYPGAYTRGESLEAAIAKMEPEIRSWLAWAGKPLPGNIVVSVVQDAVCDLEVRDADSDVLFESEKAPLTAQEYEELKALALKSAADFLALYQAVPDKNAHCAPARRTFYGPVPRTAAEMYQHTKNVNAYYFGEIGVDADNEGTILTCRQRGFATLEQQPGFLSNPTFEGSWGECWSLRKLLRRFIWHDRIHAKALYRLAVTLWGNCPCTDYFSLQSLI